MVQISPAPIVAAQDSRDHPTLIPPDKAHSLVAEQIVGDLLPTIRFAKSHALLRSPESEHVVVVTRRHLIDLEAHRSRVGVSSDLREGQAIRRQYYGTAAPAPSPICVLQFSICNP
jgi:hypothetical protein